MASLDQVREAIQRVKEDPKAPSAWGADAEWKAYALVQRNRLEAADKLAKALDVVLNVKEGSLQDGTVILYWDDVERAILEAFGNE